VGHIPFFEEPEKTRDAILTFVKRVAKVRLFLLQASPVSHTSLAGTGTSTKGNPGGQVVAVKVTHGGTQ